MSYTTLMSPGTIGSLQLRNRILMTPMGSNLAQADGHCDERIQAYYEARARGGAGAVIVGVAAIAWPQGACNPNQVAISSDDFLPGLTELAARVKRHDCRAVVQLQHAGKVAVCDISAGRAMLVPSVPAASKSDMMEALTPEEMGSFVRSYSAAGAKIAYRVATSQDLQWLVATFAEAALRAQQAGFDAVEIHAGHGYIISEFLSPHANKRDDEYGGVLENRARLLVEVIQAVKAKCGVDFPLWCRLDSKEYRVPGGIVFADAIKTAQIAEAAGADAIHVSAYADPAIGAAFTEAPLVHEPGAYLGFAAGIKAAISIPVIAVGRIEPEVAESVLRAGEADFIAMGRKLLADPELPNKLKANTPEQIRPCIYCYTCVSQIFLNKQVMCAVNPSTGFETERLLSPAAQVRHILVVGGGPAGLEAARVAALRGHKVTLCEASHRLGGTVFFSAIAYAPNERLITYLEASLKQLAIDIRLNTRVDQALVSKLQPDAVIIAVGALRPAPSIPGSDQAHVFSGDELRQLMTGDNSQGVARKLNVLQRLVMFFGGLLGVTGRTKAIRQLSKFWMPVGKRVAIIGGGLVGVELAEFLAERGRQVSVIEEGEKFGVELAVVRRWRVLHELKKHSVVLINKAVVNTIERGALQITVEDNSVVIAADTVILASGAQANRSLTEKLQAAGVEIHSVGDCDGVGYIEGAIATGNAVASRV